MIFNLNLMSNLAVSKLILFKRLKLLFKFYLLILFNNHKTYTNQLNHLFFLKKQSTIYLYPILIGLSTLAQGSNYQLLNQVNIAKCALLPYFTFSKTLNNQQKQYSIYTLYSLFYNTSSKTNAILLNSLNNSNYSFDSVYLYYRFCLENNQLILKYSNSYYSNNFFFIRFFILKFLSTYFEKKNLFIKFQNNALLSQELSVYHRTLLKRYRRLNFLKEINFTIGAFLKFLLLFLFNKEVLLFKNVLTYILENLHFKKHRKFLYNLKSILKNMITLFGSTLKVIGLNIKLKGKIGVGGNLKKKKFICRLGNFSLTKKKQKLTYSKGCARTYSGTLGFEIYLIYN